MHISSKHWLHFSGGVLALVGVVFVIVRLTKHAQQIDLSSFDAVAWSIIVILALTYATANLLLACAWWYLLKSFDVKVDLKWAVKIYGLSQLAKYVPGNIFHLAGRQALAMAANLPAGAVAKSILWELVLIASTGVVFGFLTLPLAWTNLPVWVSSSAFLLMTIGCVVALLHIFSAAVSAAMICQNAFLMVSGFIFIGALVVVVPSGSDMPDYTSLCGAYVIASLAGLITPGAPAGVGIRELVLLFLLGGQIAQADLLLAVILGRMITVLGDSAYFVISAFFPDQVKSKQA